MCWCVRSGRLGRHSDTEAAAFRPCWLPAHVTHGHSHALECVPLHALHICSKAVTRNMGFLFLVAARKPRGTRASKNISSENVQLTLFLSLNYC